jgi:hypothetical protein
MEQLNGVAETPRELQPLEGILLELSHYPDPEESQLAVEHLESARRFYLGGQLEEFGLAMDLANSALDQISDSGVRDAARQAIELLLRHQSHIAGPAL